MKVLLRFDESNMNTLSLECFLCVFKLFLVVSKLFATKVTMMFWSLDMSVACLVLLFD